MQLEKTQIDREKKIIEVIVTLFCSKVHRINTGLCPDCQALLDYAYKRLDKCPFGNQKPSCSKCTIHCYEKEMRGKIRRVMGFSGPRMLFYHPITALRHYLKR